jgi:hypothetical protein
LTAGAALTTVASVLFGHPLFFGAVFYVFSLLPAPHFAAVAFVFLFFDVSSLTWANTSSLGLGQVAP